MMEKPVAVTLGSKIVHRCFTVAEAEHYLEVLRLSGLLKEVERGDYSIDAPEEMVNPRPLNKVKLWESQKQWWPTSIRLDPAEVIQLIADKKLRAFDVAMTIQHESGVFYRIVWNHAALHESLGFRYGIEKHEYLSFGAR